MSLPDARGNGWPSATPPTPQQPPNGPAPWPAQAQRPAPGAYYDRPLPAQPPMSPYPAPYPQYPPQYPPYAPPGYMYTPPPARKRDIYRLVVSIIALVALCLLSLGGVIVTLLLLLAAFSSSLALRENYLVWPSLVLLSTLALGGGGIGIYQTIRAMLGRPSAAFRLPHFLVPLVLTILVYAAAIVQFDLGRARGSAVLQTPLLLMATILPALTYFTLAAQRLRFATTWRRAWMSFISGIFLSALIASILNTVAAGVLATLLRVATPSIGITIPSDTNGLIFIVLLVSLVAPIVEESMKPIAGLILIGRLKSPAEAFIIGMASGIGFSIFESVSGYIGLGQADWFLIAFGRLGAALLHGLGAGMATMGWYYLFRGKGIRGRYAKGFGAIGYAIVQHGTWNGMSIFLAAAPDPLGSLLNTSVWLFGLPATIADYVILVVYGLMLTVLLIVTGRVGRNVAADPGTATPVAAPSWQPAAIGGRS